MENSNSVFDKVMLLQKAHGKFNVPVPNKEKQVFVLLSPKHVVFKHAGNFYIYEHSGLFVGKGKLYTPQHESERLSKENAQKLATLQK